MALYWNIRKLTEKHKNHVADQLLALRKALRKQITEKKDVGEFKVATWNLMHFGGTGGYKRSAESLQYIAEIIDHFDLVSIQEVKPDLKQLKQLLDDYLGNEWDYIVSDVTQGDAGNDERMAILYRKGRVQFSRVAGEIVLPPVKQADGTKVNPRQFARTPYFLGFQAGWFKFKLCSVHIHYGSKSGKNREIRIEEISQLAKQLTERSDNEREAEIEYAKSRKWDTTPSAANYILLGDFNIHNSRDQAAMKALTENGFAVPNDIKGMNTNTGKKGEPFDQIAFRLNDARFTQGAGGVFDFRPYTYATRDSEFYRTLRTKRNKPPAGLEKIAGREPIIEKKVLKLQADVKKLADAIPAASSATDKEVGKLETTLAKLEASALKLAHLPKKKKTDPPATPPSLATQIKNLKAAAKELTTEISKKEYLETCVVEGTEHYLKQTYRKNQISDHLPLWTSFKIDYADEYLKKLSKEES